MKRGPIVIDLTSNSTNGSSKMNGFGAKKKPGVIDLSSEGSSPHDIQPSPSNSSASVPSSFPPSSASSSSSSLSPTAYSTSSKKSHVSSYSFSSASIVIKYPPHSPSFWTTHLEFTVFLVAGLCTRLYGLTQPSEVVFDEVHFGGFVNHLFNGSYFFDIHPPLGKLLLFWGAKFFGYSEITPCSFEKLGTEFAACSHLSLRILPALFGSFIPAIMFLLVQRMGCSKNASRFAAILALFDNALIVQSRGIWMEAFLLTFHLLGLYMSLRVRSQLIHAMNTNTHDDKSKFSMIPMSVLGLLLGCLVSTKWVPGIALFATVFIHQCISPIVHARVSLKWTTSKLFKFIIGRLPSYALCYLFIPFVFYVSTYVIHFSLLPYTGPGDVFHTIPFQKTIVGNPHVQDQAYEPMGFVDKFIELNKQHYYMQYTTGDHPYASKWTWWLVGSRPIWYWGGQSKTVTGQERRIYLASNPAVWGTALVSIVFMCLLGTYRVGKAVLDRIWKRSAKTEKVAVEPSSFGSSSSASFSESKLRKRKNNGSIPNNSPRIAESEAADTESDFFSSEEKAVERTTWMLASNYLLNLLPYIFVSRTTFLYHYLPPLLAAIAVSGFVFDWIVKHFSFSSRTQSIGVAVISAVVLCNFIHLSPATYGFSVPASVYTDIIFDLIGW